MESGGRSETASKRLSRKKCPSDGIPEGSIESVGVLVYLCTPKMTQIIVFRMRLRHPQRLASVRFLK